MIPKYLDDALGFNINRTGLLFYRELSHALYEFKITPEQWVIMITLWSTGRPVSQTEIVQLTLKDKHSVSRIIQRLERLGWIKKYPSKDDKRITLIHVTPKGEELKDKIPLKVNNHFDIKLKKLTIKEEKTLLKLIKKLRKYLGD
jgi:MarR family transcriptional regulator, lower aerobic nicotinate degradation pathway regulator